MGLLARKYTGRTQCASFVAEFSLSIANITITFALRPASLEINVCITKMAVTVA